MELLQTILFEILLVVNVLCLIYLVMYVYNMFYLLVCLKQKVSYTGAMRPKLIALATANNITLNDIIVIPFKYPNAFALESKTKPQIALTRPLVDSASEDELSGVFLHELGHIAHQDRRAITFVFVVCMVSGTLLTYIRLPFLSSVNNSILGFYVGFMPILFLMWYIRSREAYADQFVIERGGNGPALYSFLIKVQEIYNKRNFFVRFLNFVFMSHPSLATRRKILLEEEGSPVFTIEHKPGKPIRKPKLRTLPE